MKTQCCPHCHISFPEMKSKSFSNHVRWCKSKERGTKKFQLYCSCIQCKEQITAQNIKSHYQKHHTVKEPKSNCPQCDTPIFNNNKFCCKSCAATFSNARKDYSKFKPGPAKGTKPSTYTPWTKVCKCIICGRWHKGVSKTCSKQCKSKLLSLQVNDRIDNGWNPQENRNRSKPSYLEKSFDDWLKSMNVSNYIKNKTFRCDGKIYYGDFYFPEQSLLIELDGKQHLDSIEYDSIRDQLILIHHNVTTFRISYEEFINKTKIEQVCDLLSIKEQVTGIEPAEPIRL